MPLPDVKGPIELESLLDDSSHFEEYNDNIDGDDYSDRSGPIFYTQRPATALQHSIDWVASQCIKKAARVTTNHAHRRMSKRIILFLCLQFTVVFLVVFLAITPVILPSYVHPPQHYDDLRQRVLQLPGPGSANINNEKIFIAASVYDEGGALAGGSWGQALVKLVHILGPDNVYLSVYEDNADSYAIDALNNLANHISANKSMIVEGLDMHSLPKIRLPHDRLGTKRIEFLAEVRNRALRPLNDPASVAYDVKFDKLLYLNDVIFDPIDAANLLLSTNVDGNGRTQYHAACALDFIDPFKFYDTFASRDLEGYRMGVPIFPWFTTAGSGQSRKDVLAQKDAVRVKSCWGGMVAFEAKWFQHSGELPSLDERFPKDPTHPTAAAISDSTSPLRFRAEQELFWEASECCLIHADIQYRANPTTVDRNGNHPEVNANTVSGIYMNPYIRVAYTTQTYVFLPFYQRFERLLAPVQNILTKLAHQPGHNPRQMHEPGEELIERVWVFHPRLPGQGNITDEEDAGGRYENMTRIATPGGYCGSRKLLLIADGGDEEIENEHAGRWWSEKVPADLGA